ncbi:hypothetical protein LY76DRAFT_598954 [Colletotrichum caudatum]|nr:hypothetical protein LY76DRAFT_598954 [Colletotrichum caudatum]
MPRNHPASAIPNASIAAKRDFSSHLGNRDQQAVGITPPTILPVATMATSTGTAATSTKAAVALAKIADALLKVETRTDLQETETDSKETGTGSQEAAASCGETAERRKLLISLCHSVVAANVTFRRIPPLTPAAVSNAMSDPMDLKLAEFIRAARAVLGD